MSAEPKPAVNVRYEDKDALLLAEHYLRVREERKEEREPENLRMTLLGLKTMLEEIEAKTRVCYLEVVEVLVELDKEGR